MIMYNIGHLRTEENKEQYNKVKDGIEFILHDTVYGVSSQIHRAIDLLWLLPETEKREALREKLYDLSKEYNEILNNEFEAYRGEFELRNQ